MVPPNVLENLGLKIMLWTWPNKHFKQSILNHRNHSISIELISHFQARTLNIIFSIFQPKLENTKGTTNLTIVEEFYKHILTLLRNRRTTP